jgi:hypothetical protein
MFQLFAQLSLIAASFGCGGVANSLAPTSASSGFPQIRHLVHFQNKNPKQIKG